MVDTNKLRELLGNAEPSAWMIEYTGGGHTYTDANGERAVAETYPVRRYFGHNAIADYRNERFDDATSTPLYSLDAIIALLPAGDGEGGGDGRG